MGTSRGFKIPVMTLLGMLGSVKTHGVNVGKMAAMKDPELIWLCAYGRLGLFCSLFWTRIVGRGEFFSVEAI